MNRSPQIKGTIEIDAPIGKIKADNFLGFYGLTLAAALVAFFIYKKYGHQKVKSIFKRSK